MVHGKREYGFWFFVRRGFEGRIGVPQSVFGLHGRDGLVQE